MIISLVYLSCSCISNNNKPVVVEHSRKIVDQIAENKHKILSTDYHFFGDTLLHGYAGKLKYYFEKYTKGDSCKLGTYDDTTLEEYFEGIKLLGYLKNNNTKDSVFVLPALTVCEDGGESYYFSDTSIPRLHTESVCCHPENIFLVGDIDEDGISEIGQYTSSCVSRYKGLIVWTLKNRQWKKVGECSYDMFYEKPPMKRRVRKTGKGKFEMLEISDCVSDKRFFGKPHWLKFSF